MLWDVHLPFLLCVAVFSSSWIVIGMHTAHLGYLWPIAGRFFIAGLVLQGLLRLRQPFIHLTWQQHKHLLSQSLFMYSINFVAIYAAAQYLPSGFNALVCAMVVFFNMINAKLILGRSSSFSVLLGILLGFVGLAITVLGDMSFSQVHSKDLSWGIALGLLGAFLTSVGQTRLTRLGQYDLSSLVINAYGMLYGALITAGAAILQDGLPNYDLMTSDYLLSLLYLALVPTALGFMLFTRLIQKIGPQKASYVFVLSPISALIVSHFAGESLWKAHTTLGVSCILVGYLLFNTSFSGRSSRIIPEVLEQV